MFEYFHCLIMLIVTINYLLTYLYFNLDNIFYLPHFIYNVLKSFQLKIDASSLMYYKIFHPIKQPLLLNVTC